MCADRAEGSDTIRNWLDMDYEASEGSESENECEEIVRLEDIEINSGDESTE